MQRIIRSRLGISSRMDSPDRRFQEEILIPIALKDSSARKVLYVGVAWYTFHYYKTFFHNMQLTTLDISQEQAVYGAKDHVVGDLETAALISRAPFDIIFFLGVLNYGINDTQAFRSALISLDRLLSENACCYLTVEEDISGGKPSSITSDTMLEIARSMNFHAIPISEWFKIINGRARTRFYVMARSSQPAAQVLSRFSSLNQ